MSVQDKLPVFTVCALDAYDYLQYSTQWCFMANKERPYIPDFQIGSLVVLYQVYCNTELTEILQGA